MLHLVKCGGSLCVKHGVREGQDRKDKKIQRKVGTDAGEPSAEPC